MIEWKKEMDSLDELETERRDKKRKKVHTVPERKMPVENRSRGTMQGRKRTKSKYDRWGALMYPAPYGDEL